MSTGPQNANLKKLGRQDCKYGEMMDVDIPLASDVEALADQPIHHDERRIVVMEAAKTEPQEVAVTSIPDVAAEP